MTSGKREPIVPWVSDIDGLMNLLGKRFSCLLILDNKVFREYLLVIRDQVKKKTRGLLKVTIFYFKNLLSENDMI